MRRYQRPDEAASRPVAEGAFTNDGCYLPEAGLFRQGAVHHLVSRMVAGVKRGGLTPTLAARQISEAKAEVAFPNYVQWATAEGWFACRASTSAEEAVKRMGGAEGGHWCGGRWVSGREKDCPERGHYRAACTPEAWKQLAELGVYYPLEGGDVDTDAPSGDLQVVSRDASDGSLPGPAES